MNILFVMRTISFRLKQIIKLRPTGPICVVSMLLAIFISVSCNHDMKRGSFSWPSTGMGSVDSLTLFLDKGYSNRISSDSLQKALDALKKIYAENPRKDLKARIAFFEGWSLVRKAEIGKADSIMKEVLSDMDSSSTPYEYHRFLYMMDNDASISPGRFEKINNWLKFYERWGDDFMSAAMLTVMGNFLKNCRDTQGALKAYSRADSLFLEAGTPEQTLYNRINRASLLAVRKDTSEAIKMASGLLKEPTLMEKTDLRTMVFEHMFLYTQEGKWLDSIQNAPGGSMGAFNLLYRAQTKLQDSYINDAENYASKAYEAALEAEDYEIAALADYTWAEALAAKGDKTSAYDRLKEAVDITDQIAELKSMDEIRAMETLRIINERRLAEELDQSRRTLFWVWIAFSVLLLVIIGVWSALMYVRNARIRQLKLRLEREKAQRSLIASSMIIEDKERLLEEVEKRLAELPGSEERQDNSKEDISRSIRLSQMAEKNREGMLEAYKEVNPAFINALKNKATDLTESDIRFACYISIGLDNKAIANMTGIRHESVKQARWRLRKKLGLATADSLEDFLRNLSNSPE